MTNLIRFLKRKIWDSWFLGYSEKQILVVDMCHAISRVIGDRYGLESDMERVDVIFGSGMGDLENIVHAEAIAYSDGSFELKFNLDLISEDVYDVEKLKHLIFHELAHIACFSLYNYSGHGRPWQAVMVDCGYSPAGWHGDDIEVCMVGVDVCPVNYL